MVALLVLESDFICVTGGSPVQRIRLCRAFRVPEILNLAYCMRVAFVFDGYGLRGVELTMFWFAHFNELLLHNTSVIVCRAGRPTSEDTPPAARQLFERRFAECHEVATEAIDQTLISARVDVCIIAISGGEDCFVPRSVPTITHCVFRADVPLGTLQTAISHTVSLGRVPVLPNIVHLPQHTDTLREALRIPAGATVFGRYGGWDTFDIQFAQQTVLQVATERPDLYFVFMNTKPFGKRPNIVYLRGTPDMHDKRAFINTCDAMLHAGSLGETFGIACGEFALAGKPVITSTMGNGEHRRILGPKAILYRDAAELKRILTEPLPAVDMTTNGYQAYGPEPVMAVFRAALAQCLVRAWGPLALSYDETIPT